MNRIQQIYQQGQSVWCDNLSRSMIDAGELRRLIGLGVVGVTSNPTIFMKAITQSADYDEAFQGLLEKGVEVADVLYERLVLPDIAEAADQLRPVYDRTGGVDGFVSLEVSPKLAFDTDATIAEAKRLWSALDRPNVYIKVPATDEGVPAIESLIAEGMNVNVTLIFSVAMYNRVMRAHLNGLDRFLVRGGDASRVSSVASFFVSRIDSAVDKLLERAEGEGHEVDHLFGETAVANAKLAYARFQETFDLHGDFGELAAQGARVQRPLWASTSTKNPVYPDTIYVDELIGPHTVNTMPPATIEAVLDHGAVTPSLTDNLDEARAHMVRLAEVGIDLTEVTDRLTVEGVDLFAKSFDELLENLQRKQSELRALR